MNKNYIKQLVLLLAFIPFVGVSATEYMNVYLTTQGAFQSINIDEIDKITFPSEDEVNITISGMVTPMAIDNIEVITFGDTDITAIEESEVETAEIEILYIVSTGEVKVISSEVVNQVQLYNMQGVLMQTVAHGVDVVTLNVSNYPNGIYIVVAQSGEQVVTKKIIK